MVIVFIQSFIFLFGPAIIFLVGLTGIRKSLKTSKKYLAGHVLLFLGAVTYYYGLLVVGAWEGMAISFVIGGGLALLGSVVLLITFLVSKLAKANTTVDRLKF